MNARQAVDHAERMTPHYAAYTIARELDRNCGVTTTDGTRCAPVDVVQQIVEELLFATVEPVNARIAELEEEVEGLEDEEKLANNTIAELRGDLKTAEDDADREQVRVLELEALNRRLAREVEKLEEAAKSTCDGLDYGLDCQQPAVRRYCEACFSARDEALAGRIGSRRCGKNPFGIPDDACGLAVDADGVHKGPCMRRSRLEADSNYKDGVYVGGQRGFPEVLPASAFAFGSVQADVVETTLRGGWEALQAKLDARDAELAALKEAMATQQAGIVKANLEWAGVFCRKDELEELLVERDRELASFRAAVPPSAGQASVPKLSKMQSTVLKLLSLTEGGVAAFSVGKSTAARLVQYGYAMSYVPAGEDRALRLAITEAGRVALEVAGRSR